MERDPGGNVPVVLEALPHLKHMPPFLTKERTKQGLVLTAKKARECIWLAARCPAVGFHDPGGRQECIWWATSRGTCCSRVKVTGSRWLEGHRAGGSRVLVLSSLGDWSHELYPHLLPPGRGSRASPSLACPFLCTKLSVVRPVPSPSTITLPGW